MYCILSLRRVAVALPALILLGLGGPLPAAQAADFEARATATPTATHGNVKVGVLEGQAAPGGRFSGTFSHAFTAHGRVLDGSATLDFASGSLTIAYRVEFNPETNLYEGVYEITSGTGAFEDAVGEGIMVSERAAPAQVMLVGTLDR